ncbi:MAG: ATP-binding protein, partial [Pseudomonadota bacterium]
FFALLSFICTAATILVGAFVFFRNTRSPVHQLFALGCLAAGEFSFCEFMYRQAETAERAQFWLYAGSFWPFALAFLAHFAGRFTRTAGALRASCVLLLYLPATAFSLFELVSHSIYPDVVRCLWGFSPRPNLASAMFVPLAAWTVAMSILPLAVLARYARKLTDRRQIVQARYLVVALALPLASTVTEMLLPLFHVEMPELSSVSLVCCCLLIGFAITRHGLFALDLSAAAEDIVRIMPDCLALVGVDGRIVRANQALAALLGIADPEALASKPFASLFADEDATTWIDGIQAGGHLSVEASMSTVSGEKRPVSLVGAPAKDRNGRLLGFVFVARDLSGQKRAQRQRELLREQVYQSERLASVGQLAAGVAHEINNPLAVIYGFAQELERRVRTSEHAESWRLPVVSIVREAQRCRSLVQELLTFSRTTKKTTEIIDLNEVVRASVVLLGARAKLQATRIVQELSVDLVPLCANQTQLQQVIVNLGTNALDAMKEGGTLTLRTCLNDRSRVVLDVADTGPGIPVEIRGRVFEPFFTTKEVGKGTGLGLSLVYEIVQQHGASIDFHTEVDRGTLFRISFPASTADRQ